MNLHCDDFALYGLPQRFQQNRAQIDATWKDLQRQVHPDKFVDQGAAAQRVAMQWSVRINEAYQRLKDPLRRAAYLCELHGVPVNAQDNTAMPTSFLMQQMQWREQLEDARSAEDIQKISSQCQQAMSDALHQIARLIDDQQAWPEAVAQVRALMFIERFNIDIDTRLDQMDT